MRLRTTSLALLGVLLTTGCYRTTGFCDTEADCQAGQTCSEAFQCVAREPAMELPLPCPPLQPGRSAGFLWAKTFGGRSGSKGVSVDAVACYVAVTGAFSGTADLGAGPRTSRGISDIFAALYDQDGGHVWSAVIGGDRSDTSSAAIAMDRKGGVVMTGTFNGTTDFGTATLTRRGALDGFVVRYGGPQRALRWTRQLSGDTAVVEPRALAVDAAGDVIVVGTIIGVTNLGGEDLRSVGLRDIFVARYAGEGGQHLWSRRLGGEKEDVATAVAFDEGGNILITGAIGDTADLGRGPMSAQGIDGFVASYGADGQVRWISTVSGPGRDEVLGLALAPDGTTVITGTLQQTASVAGQKAVSQGKADGFVAKLGPDGKAAWVVPLGSAGSTTAARAVALTTAGNVAVTGSFQGKVDVGGGQSLVGHGVADIFIVRYTPDGFPLFSRAYGDAGGFGESSGLSLIADPQSDEVTTVGHYAGKVDFGDGDRQSAGASAVFILRHGLSGG